MRAEPSSWGLPSPNSGRPSIVQLWFHLNRTAIRGSINGKSPFIRKQGTVNRGCSRGSRMRDLTTETPVPSRRRLQTAADNVPLMGLDSRRFLRPTGNGGKQ
ncbi:hypothetical protein VTI74DRAFT_6004 [Chaetomium olivicolor]